MACDNQSLTCQSSNETKTPESPSKNIQQWFDEYNTHPENLYLKCRDSTSPYFVQQNSLSNSPTDSTRNYVPDFAHGHTSGSSDEFRSVIDDLTIENKRLREELRRYKKRTNRQLEENKLFEIRIHALPPAKRRELENALHSFASSLDYSRTEQDSAQDTSSKQCRLSPKSNLPLMKKSSLSGTSNSGIHNSSNTSIKASSHTTPVDQNTSATEKTDHTNFNPSKSKDHHEFPPDNQTSIPFEYSLRGMTDKQKKNLVVQRLEQLFMGGKGTMMGATHQAFRQQEISRSAHVIDNELVPHGTREANMQPPENTDLHKVIEMPPNIEKTPSDESGTKPLLSDQRPTDPMDLDPDRNQVPSDNVEYIRHLGLAAPKLASNEETELSNHNGGWVYLNLLINMAQLHMINVTVDFVRSAVLDFSEKFQLSKDGRMLRWKVENIKDQSLNNGYNSMSGKTQFCDTPNNITHHLSKAQETVQLPVTKYSLDQLTKPHRSSVEFQYKPLFYHRLPSEDSLESNDSLLSPSRTTQINGTSDPSSQTQKGCEQALSFDRKNHDDGSMTFYGGANFCIDLTRNRDIELVPPICNVLNEGSDSEPNPRLGTQHSKIRRTSSGSLLPYRPFKQTPSFQNLKNIEKSDIVPKSPEEFPNDGLCLSQFPTNSQQEPTTLKQYKPYGVEETKNSDSFGIRVLTRRSVAHMNKSCRRPPSHTSIRKRLKFRIHRPSSSHLESKESCDYTDEKTKALTNNSCQMSLFKIPPSPENLPIKTDIISTNFTFAP